MKRGIFEPSHMGARHASEGQLLHARDEIVDPKPDSDCRAAD